MSTMIPAINLSTIDEVSESRLSVLEETMQKCSEKKCECEKFKKVMAEYEKLNLNKTILGTFCVSFLEAEMQICSEQGCTCDQFESMVKEYTHLLESFNPLKSAEQKLVDALQTIEKLQNADASKENEIQILRNENEKLITEVLEKERKISNLRNADLSNTKELQNFRNENEKLKNKVLEKERKISNFVEEIDNLKKNLSDAEGTNEVLKQQNSGLIESLAVLREANANTLSEEINDEEIVNGQISSDDSGNDENRDQSDGEEDVACSGNELQDEEDDNDSSDPSSSDESAASKIKFCKKCKQTKYSCIWYNFESRNNSSGKICQNCYHMGYPEQRELNNEKCKKCQMNYQSNVTTS